MILEAASLELFNNDDNMKDRRASLTIPSSSNWPASVVVHNASFSSPLTVFLRRTLLVLTIVAGSRSARIFT